MGRTFNTNGYCDPDLHYMVNLTDRLSYIKSMIDAGYYFSINKARQYGKTTTLSALADYIAEDYNIINLDFQGFSYDDFKSEQSFIIDFSRQILLCTDNLPADIEKEFEQYSNKKMDNLTLSVLFISLLKLCKKSQKKIVLIIDEADSATNNQVFLDFLAQLRFYYLRRKKTATFQSVILACVYDIRIIRQNSPWNMREGNESNECLHSFDDCPRDHRMLAFYDIAADFDVDMSFSPEDISGMLAQYEDDHHTGMNIHEISDLIYEYTSGYPFLVSRLCKLMDEKIAPAEHFADTKNVWTKSGFLGAVKLLLSEKNALFESLIGKLNNYPALRHMLYLLLFQGQAIMYNADDTATDMLLMFGFLKAEHETVRIANRIFETRLYNYFLTLPEAQNGDLYRLALQNRNLFIQNGQLDMKCVLAKFVEHFDDIYGDLEQTFYEEDGRRYFMLYLKPIINGVGNYYVEAQTRNQERTDLIIDYLGIQYIIEMKVWRGNAYNKRGEQQLIDYLDHYHLKTGYMLSFNFNQKKTPGIKEIRINDKILIEAVV